MGKTHQLLKQIEQEKLSRSQVPSNPANDAEDRPKTLTYAARPPQYNYIKVDLTAASFALAAVVILLVLNISLLYVVKRYTSGNTVTVAKLNSIEKALAVSLKNEKILASAMKEMDSKVRNSDAKTAALEGQIGAQSAAVKNLDETKDGLNGRISSLEREVINLKSAVTNHPKKR